MKDILKAIVYGGLFIIPLLPLYVANDMFFPFITGKNFSFRIIVEIVFAAWVILAFLDKRYRPGFSWILVTFGVFVLSILVSAFLGEHTQTSLWSNYERMDGVVTLIHLALFVLVLGSTFQSDKVWNWLLFLTTGVALVVAGMGLNDFLTSGVRRIDSTLGNAAYMAVYMLFHIFFTAYLFMRTKDPWLRLVYVLVAMVFMFALLQTGTRGTFLGMVGGLVAMVSYIALFGSRFPEFRKVAVGSILVLIVLGGTFMSLRDSDIVQDNRALARIANIDLSADLEVRSVIWGLAMEGVRERPLFGWGHGNYNFVFNKYYDPFLYEQESWFDRVHNIFLDWLIAGGVVGFLAYFSVFFALFYYLVWRPYWSKEPDPHFNVLERAVIVGLLVGYLIHNAVVFDNIISYIFFGVLLALVHGKVATPIKAISELKFDKQMVVQFVTPLVLIVLGATIYYVNIPSYLAAKDIIDALRARDVSVRIESFERALARGGFGRQEIVEQLSQQAIRVARDPNVSEEERRRMLELAITEMEKLTQDKPGDARLHQFFSSLYRSVGAYEEAREQASLARQFSPLKQSIITEQGVVELQAGEAEKALEFLREAFELDTSFVQPRVLYASVLVNTGAVDKARELLSESRYLRAFALNDFAVSTVQQSGEFQLLAEMFEERVKADPDDVQSRASLAFLYHQLEDKERAIATLRETVEIYPEFAGQAECIIGNIEAGNPPEQDC